MAYYNLFISHSWSYEDSYEGLIELLDEKEYFTYRDYSVPKDDPVHTSGTDEELYEAIKNKIELCNVVLVLAGVYSTYSKWINKEIEIAKEEFEDPKPIVGIRPWAAERISDKVQENSDEIVGWNSDSIVSAIRNLT
ncbi:TIR domain-containing protein [Halarsenatibacter silvermanii]|uniref:MTH538 TIR-like domain n=1 Tax=Halarsenatibacter silvermanii TaxID=321763 RepID=A0A1G9RDW0_9FIRM|nr:TIR domain-containing protein [Halarsenatibacter silvermanii]SDM21482.1 MTH538 TIR-like domain [Halarsenatibacter silvermanii]